MSAKGKGGAMALFHGTWQVVLGLWDVPAPKLQFVSLSNFSCVEKIESNLGAGEQTTHNQFPLPCKL